MTRVLCRTARSLGFLSDDARWGSIVDEEEEEVAGKWRRESRERRGGGEMSEGGDGEGG